MFGYAKRTAKILGIDDDAQQRMMMGGLCCALERALSDVGETARLADIVVKPATPARGSNGSQPSSATSAVDAEDAIAAVYYVCARYCEQRAVGGSDESVLEEVRKHLVGYSARLSVFEALKQAVSDEAFPRRLNERAAERRRGRAAGSAPWPRSPRRGCRSRLGARAARTRGGCRSRPRRPRCAGAARTGAARAGEYVESSARRYVLERGALTADLVG